MRAGCGRHLFEKGRQRNLSSGLHQMNSADDRSGTAIGSPAAVAI
ncbi:hypothetical protein SXCC_01502 [Gluconacetobacter sp. SXCC-1]|nr:hypothetical protein SXCC_01502 [Gluconacetobacter sp. SXCC-1]